MSDPVTYDFAVLCLRPRAHAYDSTAVGVLVHARTEDWIDARVVTDPGVLAARVPGSDAGRMARYLENWQRIARGDASAGPLALLPPSERFHWLTAPRSDLLHASPVHSGRSTDLPATLATLFRDYVGPDAG